MRAWNRVLLGVWLVAMVVIAPAAAHAQATTGTISGTATAELQGFTAARRDNLTVEIGRDVAADFSLKVGTLTEQVTVQGAATNVELSSAVAGGVVTTTQIAELPLNG